MFCALLVHHSLSCRLCLQRCFQLVISFLLEIIVILLEDQMDFCALLGGTTVSLVDLVSRDVSTGYFFSSGDDCFFSTSPLTWSSEVQLN